MPAGGRTLTGGIGPTRWIEGTARPARIASLAARPHHVPARVYLFVFYRIPPIAGNEISAEISPNFANSERKENLNSKTKFRWIPTEIRWFSTGKWCQLWFSYCFWGQMKNFWIPTLFIFSRSTTFVSGTFSFEQWFESYLIISKTTNLKSCHFMWQPDPNRPEKCMGRTWAYFFWPNQKFGSGSGHNLNPRAGLMTRNNIKTPLFPMQPIEFDGPVQQKG